MNCGKLLGWGECTLDSESYMSQCGEATETLLSCDLRVRWAETDAQPREAEGVAKTKLLLPLWVNPVWGPLYANCITMSRAIGQWSGVMWHLILWAPSRKIWGKFEKNVRKGQKLSLWGPDRPVVLSSSNTEAAYICLTPSWTNWVSLSGSGDLAGAFKVPQLIPRCRLGPHDHRFCLFLLLD